MLIAGTVLLGGVGTSYLLCRRWRISIWNAIAVPLLAVAALWSLTILPVVLIGVAAIYAGATAWSTRTGDTERSTTSTILVGVGSVLLLGVVTTFLSSTGSTTLRSELLLGTLLSVPVGYGLLGLDHDRRWFEAGVTVIGVTAFGVLRSRGGDE
jgi:hypothetical protein